MGAFRVIILTIQLANRYASAPLSTESNLLEIVVVVSAAVVVVVVELHSGILYWFLTHTPGLYKR